MTAAELLGNSHLAWRISQPAPVGDATAEEAAHPTVVEKAVLIAAELGLLDDVSRMLGEVEDPLVRHQADALVARRRGDSDAERSSTTVVFVL